MEQGDLSELQASEPSDVPMRVPVGTVPEDSDVQPAKRATVYADSTTASMLNCRASVLSLFIAGKLITVI